MFSYVSLEERVPQDHPLRAIRKGNEQEAKLSYLGHALIENRNGMIWTQW